jgi:hypothetical protein
MTDDTVRDEIAFIRRAIEEGRGYATGRSADLLVWGLAMAAAHLGTYATVKGWWRVDPSWMWTVFLVVPWLYSLRRWLRRLLAPSSATVPPAPMARVLQMVWLGCGIFLTTLGVAANLEGDMRQGWFYAVAAGTLGVAFFATSWLANLSWMRWVAVGWWLGELAVYALRHRADVLPLMAVLMLVLLALPGLLLLRGRPASGHG